MTKQEELISEITASVTKSVMQAMDEKLAGHMCPLNPNDRRVVPDLYSMFRDLGDGDLSKGIRKMRRFFVFIENMYNKKTVFTGTIFALSILAFSGFLVTHIWGGMVDAIKHLFGIE